MKLNILSSIDQILWTNKSKQIFFMLTYIYSMIWLRIISFTIADPDEIRVT